jgi:hypothetical protein
MEFAEKLILFQRILIHLRQRANHPKIAKDPILRVRSEEE